LFSDSISSRVCVVLRLQQKPFYFLGVGLLNIVLSLSLNYYLIKIYEMGVLGAVLALLIVAFIQMIVLFPIIISSVSPFYFNFNLFKKMFHFALPFLPSAILFVIMGFSDRWFIKYFLNTESVGLYGAGYKLASIMSLVITAFNLNWQPYYLKFKNNDNNRFGSLGNLVIIALILIFTLLIYFVQDIASLNFNGLYLIGANFQKGLTIVPYIALGYLFYGIYVLQMPSIFILNKQNWGLVFWSMGALINIIGNCILIPRFGLVGAAYSSAFSYLIMMLSLSVCNLIWMPIKYNLSYIALNVFVSVFVLVLKFYISSQLYVFAACLYIMVPAYSIYKLNQTLVYD
jgi:O-antigen/teichoic acid export membrane protein